MKLAFEIISLIILLGVMFVLSLIFSPPNSQWKIGTVKNEFDDPIKYIAEFYDSNGIRLTYHESNVDRFSFFRCDVVESTGAIGNADIKLQDQNKHCYETYWIYTKYDHRKMIDSYVIVGKDAMLLKRLILSNDAIKISFRDSAGLYIVKNIQCGGFDNICDKVRKK